MCDPRNAYRILVGNSQKTKNGWEDNINMIMKLVSWSRLA